LFSPNPQFCTIRLPSASSQLARRVLEPILDPPARRMHWHGSADAKQAAGFSPICNFAAAARERSIR
jgi:hypothetical protein